MQEKIKRGNGADSGLTFFDFMVILAFLGILAAIAIPDFLKYGARPMQIYAKNNLGSIYAAQSSYFEKHGTYAGGPDCFKLLDWKPKGKGFYAYYCGEDVVPCTKKKCTSCAGASLLPAPPESTTAGFTIYAVGNVDRDSADCDVWSMNDAKALKNDVNDVAN